MVEYKTSHQRRRDLYKTVHAQRMIDLRKPKARKVGALAERLPALPSKQNQAIYR